MYSRRSKVEESKNRKKAYLFIFLTFASVILIFFYGLPAVIKFAAFLTEINQSTQPVETSDETPPPPPKINSLPSATKEDNIEIKGNTEAGAKVTIFVNGESTEVIADSSGNFVHKSKLTKGENFISAKSTDTSGNESQKSETQKIIFDTEPPSLEILKPKDRSEFFGSLQRQIIIEGITEEYSKVQINGRQVVVGQDGGFTYSTTLQEGENSFTVSSEDEAGNKTETSFSVSFTA